MASGTKQCRDFGRRGPSATCGSGVRGAPIPGVGETLTATSLDGCPRWPAARHLAADAHCETIMKRAWPSALLLVTMSGCAQGCGLSRALWFAIVHNSGAPPAAERAAAESRGK